MQPSKVQRSVLDRMVGQGLEIKGSYYLPDDDYDYYVGAIWLRRSTVRAMHRNKWIAASTIEPHKVVTYSVTAKGRKVYNVNRT